MPVALLVVAAAATTYGAIAQKQAADTAAQVDVATANYNAKYDESLAAQTDLDTQANIKLERQDNAVYLSRQAASYAAAGVSSTTGSALDAQITNAGRFEQRIQQDWVNSQRQQAAYRSKALAGIAAGGAEAQADRMKGSIALIDGGAKLATLGVEGYAAGIFKQKNNDPGDQSSELD